MFNYFKTTTFVGSNSLIVYTQVKEASPPAEHPDTTTLSATWSSVKYSLIMDLVILSPLK